MSQGRRSIIGGGLITRSSRPVPLGPLHSIIVTLTVVEPGAQTVSIDSTLDLPTPGATRESIGVTLDLP